MIPVDQFIAEGSGHAFELARRVARQVLKRAFQHHLRVIVQQEVQTAVLEHLESVQGRPPVAFAQIVVGEVYNVAERFDGVVRVGDELHLEDGGVSIDSLRLDDPRLNAAVQRAQARLATLAEGAPADAEPLFPTSSPGEAPAPGGPTFDSAQRLSRRSAEQYRERLERRVIEDRTR